MTNPATGSDRATTAAGLVIAGASHCGVQSAFAARRFGYSGPITLFSDESRLPYHRPPLSKDVLVGSRSIDQISLRPERAYAKSDIALRLDSKVVEIDRGNRYVVIDNGDRIDYTHLLLATGARPRPLEVDGSALEGIHYIRSAADVEGVLAEHGKPRTAAVVGGGYIGLEVASSLRKLGARVTIIEAMERVLQRVASPALSSFYTRMHREEGVTVMTESTVDGFVGQGRATGLRLQDGRTIEADLVVVGIGVIPNDELAVDAGLTVDDGIVVDEFARTSDPHIYAAGDCARGLNTHYGNYLRVESVQNANDQGRVAARHIAGHGEPYEALPWFWSDQFDAKLQIAGLPDEASRLVVRGDPTIGRSFSLCHLQDDVLTAVEAVNVPADFLGAKVPIIARARMDVTRLADPENAIADCSLR